MTETVYELHGLAIGMASPSLARDTVTRAADEIERLTARTEKAEVEVDRLRAALNEALTALVACGDDLSGEVRAEQIRLDYGIDQQNGEPK